MEAGRPTVERQSVSLSSELLTAAKRFAEQEKKTFSGVVAEALTNLLTEYGALPEQRDEREELIRGIESEFSIEELRELLTQRQRERTVAELQLH